MTDQSNIRQRLLGANNIVGQEADDYFTQLDQQFSLEPQVVLTGSAPNGTAIRVYEGVALGPTDDDPPRRGFIWFAVTGPARVYPSRRNSDGVVIPGRILGNQIAFSTRSADDALARATHKLSGR